MARIRYEEQEKVGPLFPHFLRLMSVALAKDSTDRFDTGHHYADGSEPDHFAEVRSKSNYKNSLDFCTQLFDKARIFLVNSAPEHPTGKPTFLDEGPLDLPFETCYFEHQTENMLIDVVDQTDVEQTNEIKLRTIELMFILISETEGGGYFIIAWGYERPDPLPMFFVFSDHPDLKRTKNLWLKNWVRHALASMKDQVTATERVNIKQKARINGENIHHRIREVIHIVPKKNSPIRLVSEGSTIDWTHRWEVRGHWRRIDRGLGKNRKGEYCISGFTWVSSHERGPDNKPLIKKIRIMDQRENEL